MRSAALLATALLLFTSEAALGATPDTVVRLKNGDLARGSLVELVRGDHVTIELSTGESRTYPWDDVESVKGIDATPPAPPPPPPKPAPPPQPSGAIVHIDAGEDFVSLSRSIGQGSTWAWGSNSMMPVSVEIFQSVCPAPCGRPVPAGAYVMTGDGLSPSRSFLVPDSGEITLHAQMRSKGRRTGGIVLLSIGIPLTLMGGFLTAFAATSSVYDPDPKTGQPSTPRGPVLALGIGVLGVGLIGLTVGIYLLATSASEVTIDSSNSMSSFVRRGFQLTF